MYEVLLLEGVPCTLEKGSEKSWGGFFFVFQEFIFVFTVT